MSDAAPSLARAVRARVLRTPLGVKLAWLTAGVTAVVVAASLIALSARVRESTRRVFADELARNQRTLAELERRNFEQLLFGASIVATAPTLRAALAGARQDEIAGASPNPILVSTVQQAIGDLLRETGKDLLAVTDDSGRVFVASVHGGPPIQRRADLRRMPAVRSALDPSAPADSGTLAVLRAADALYQVAVYPLVLDGYTLGAVVLGERLDSAFVSALGPGAGGQVLVASDGRVLLGTLGGAPGVALPDRPTAAPTVLRAGGEDQVAAGVSLGVAQDGAPVTLWLLHPLTPTVRSLTRPLFWNFIWVGALAVLVAGVVAAFAARSVLRPLGNFVRFLRSPEAAGSGPGGGFDTDDASVEVRTLSDSFSDLMASLTAKQQQLERRTAELAAANADLTEEVHERERVEQALRDSEAQLRQAQKMEAVGRLAGGVAHDFNNLLTVISGYTQLAMRRTDRGGEGVDELREVVAAADRAANLTHQLLAFSRKQVLKPAVLDLGAVADGVAPMLRRLIGEHIDLTVQRADPLARVMADRGQIEQVLLNLAVNARDAMPRGGTLTIMTSNVSPDGASSAANAVGVALRVRDTGVGIPPEVLDRIFEPFFTTKEVGKGTGLGLSTVYGIVQQSGGTIDVDSTVGLGTTFTVILPVVSDAQAADGERDDGADLPRGTETVLLVEDEPAVRALARRTLEELGYAVIAAAEPREALEAGDAPADVVLTDVVMPGMSGPQLAEQYLARHPGTAIIYMSGYTDDALPGYEVEPGATFLRKPFTPTVLAHVVRDVLDRRARGAARRGTHA